jgi:hypothetical protein
VLRENSEIYAPALNYSCGIMRDVIISIMATLAEQERISISDSTKAGLQRARRAGKKLGRRAVAVDLDKVQRLRGKHVGHEIQVDGTIGKSAASSSASPPKDSPQTIQVVDVKHLSSTCKSSK